MPPTAPATTKQTAEMPLLTPDEFRVVVARVYRLAQHAERRNQVGCSRHGLVLLICLCGWQWSGSARFGWLAFLVVVAFVLTEYLSARGVRQEKQEIERLIKFVENTQDVAQLGTILDLAYTASTLQYEWRILHSATYNAICRLIPSIQSQHAPDLNTQQRAKLHGMLVIPDWVERIPHWKGFDYFLPLLYALEQIGDKRDLPDVERLLKDNRITDEIRVAAARCAKVIRERVAREEGKDFLLRPEREPLAVATLLRPSQERQDTPPEQLLRATSDTNAPPDC